jgi:hypothetical protein
MLPLRAWTALALVLALAAPAAAAEKPRWTSWIPFVGTDEPPPPPKIRAGSARASSRDARTPVFVRGVQRQTSAFFDTLEDALRLNRKKKERRPVSGQTRKWKTADGRRPTKPWYDFWSNDE